MSGDLLNSTGARCVFPGCQQYDFLPFTCNKCHNKFCGDHRLYEDHDCAVHKADLQQHQATSSSSTNNYHFECCFGECKKVEVMPIKCAACEKNFCVAHRLPEDHACASVLNKVAEPNLWAKKKKPVDTLKFSNNIYSPVGQSSIEQQDRIHLDVYFHPDVKTPPCHMFFNKVWSVGRCTDLIGIHAKVVNENANPNTPEEKKWRLFDMATGKGLCHSSSLDDSCLQDHDCVMLLQGTTINETLQKLAPPRKVRRKTEGENFSTTTATTTTSTSSSSSSSKEEEGQRIAQATQSDTTDTKQNTATTSAEHNVTAAPELSTATALTAEEVQQTVQEWKPNNTKFSALGVKEVPAQSRIVLIVLSPTTTTAGYQSQWCCVDKTWTVGRALDALCKHCKVVNKNNQAGVDSRLSLFHLRNCNLLPNAEKISVVLKNGDCIMLCPGTMLAPEVVFKVQTLQNVSDAKLKRTVVQSCVLM
eukprot:TRINITY_DN954_c0_g1_i1.p1 TRINITY_DN954_c0_g1~~TRINITY_DN954_c0_g1_i1.p1  ORF type:complete len:475 (-),score=58.55 TRINITY_DN954_c0_g1_i1:1012-2436(-)